MAELDLSDAFGFELLDEFAVIRRQEFVDSNGEAAVARETLGAVGVVTRASPDQLSRLPEADLAEAHICVVTEFRLRGPAREAGDVQFKPDLIQWQGSTFIVKQLDPYTNFGAGFVQAIAGSIDSVDEAPE